MLGLGRRVLGLQAQRAGNWTATLRTENASWALGLCVSTLEDI